MDISGAIPKPRATYTKIQSPKGFHKAQFIGMSEPETVTNEFETCRRCQGGKVDRNGIDCVACDGTGKRVEQKVKLRYHMLSSGIIEEETVNYKLGAGGQAKDGKSISPSTLYVRLAELSGENDIAGIQKWASSLTEPIAIPCMVMVGAAAPSVTMRIISVVLRAPDASDEQAAAKPVAKAARPAPPPKVKEPVHEYEIDEVPF